MWFSKSWLEGLSRRTGLITDLQSERASYIYYKRAKWRFRGEGASIYVETPNLRFEGDCEPNILSLRLVLEVVVVGRRPIAV